MEKQNNISNLHLDDFAEIPRHFQKRPSAKRRQGKSQTVRFCWFFDVCIMLDKLPTTMEFERSSGHAIKPYRKNFGSWQNTLSSFKEWLQENHPDSQFIDMIDDNGYERIASHSHINVKIDTSMVWEGKKGDCIRNYAVNMDGKRGLTR